jgi:hypothetical protein
LVDQEDSKSFTNDQVWDDIPLDDKPLYADQATPRSGKSRNQILVEWLIVLAILSVITFPFLAPVWEIFSAFKSTIGLQKTLIGMLYLAPLLLVCIAISYIFALSEEKYGRTWWWKLIFGWSNRKRNPSWGNDSGWDDYSDGDD